MRLVYRSALRLRHPRQGNGGIASRIASCAWYIARRAAGRAPGGPGKRAGRPWRPARRLISVPSLRSLNPRWGDGRDICIVTQLCARQGQMAGDTGARMTPYAPRPGLDVLCRRPVCADGWPFSAMKCVSTRIKCVSSVLSI